MNNKNTKMPPNAEICWQLQSPGAELNTPFPSTEQSSSNVLCSLKMWPQPRKVMNAAWEEDSKLFSFLFSGLESYFPAQAAEQGMWLYRK